MDFLQSKNKIIPYQDWHTLGGLSISVDSVDTSPNIAVMNFSGGAVKEIFALGDKVRLKQGGAFKYYYITNLDNTNNQFSLTGDEVAPMVVGQVVTDFAFSRSNPAIGFPSSVTVNVPITFTGTLNPAVTSLNVEMIMEGAKVRFFKKLEATVSVAGATVYVGLPVEKAQASVNPIGDMKAWYCDDSGDPMIGYPMFEEPWGGDPNIIGIYKWDITNWQVSGGEGLIINIDYEYITS